MAGMLNGISRQPRRAIQLVTRLTASVVLFAAAGCSDASRIVEGDDARLSLLSNPSVSDVIPDAYIVVFRPSVVDAPGLANRLVRENNGKLHFVYQHALKGFAATMPAPAIAGLRKNPNVAFIEQDQLAREESTTQTNATWGLDRIDQRQLPMNQTYNYDATGSGVRVYLIDGGIRFTHNEFGGRAVLGTDVYADDPTNFTNGVDCSGHGTHVGGTVGGQIYGVAKQVALVVVRVTRCDGLGAVSRFIMGVDWVAANHVKPAVANMSLGANASDALDLAVSNSIAAGVPFVVSAGNGTTDACTRSPARVSAALTVSAIGYIGDTKPSWANNGPCVDLFAPGVQIKAASYIGDTSVSMKEGTSMSAAHVSGVVALYLQFNPTATPAEVHNAILNAATTGVVNSAGAGTVNRLVYSLGDWAGAPPNQAPSAAIGSPTPGASFSAGSSVSFQGSGSDPEDGALSGGSLVWTSSINGQIGTGTSFSRNDLSVGTHTITLRATDSDGATGSAARTITISPVAANQAPSAAITSPAQGASFNAGSTVNFQGSGSDPEDGVLAGSSLVWTSSINGQIGMGTSFTRNDLSVGTHTITLIVTDNQGATGSAARTITVAPAGNQPPTAGFSYNCGGDANCRFTDSSTDPNGSVVAWSWNFGVTGGTSNLQHPAYNYLSAGTYQVRLTVTDNQGASASTTKNINCAVHKNGRLRCS